MVKNYRITLTNVNTNQSAFIKLKTTPEKAEIVANLFDFLNCQSDDALPLNIMPCALFIDDTEEEETKDEI